MRRREFMALIGGVAAAWPLAARAQQGERMRLIGVLLPLAKDDPRYQPWLTAFRQVLQELGWVDGRNIRMDIHWATNHAEIRKQAAELVALAPDVILAHGASTVGPLLQATRTVPIVFPIAGDPVGAGFVDSLARPGWQRHWLHDFRIQHEREMGGTAQTDRARCGACGSHSGRGQPHWDGLVWRHPGYGAVAQGRGDAGQHA